MMNSKWKEDIFRTREYCEIFEDPLGISCILNLLDTCRSHIMNMFPACSYMNVKDNPIAP